MSNKAGDDDLAIEVDTTTYQVRLVGKGADKAYEPPPKSERETPEQVQERLRRQRHHHRTVEVAELRDRARRAQADYEKLLARHNALERLEGPDPMRTKIFAEAQFQRRLAAAYKKRADRMEREHD